MVCCNGIGSGGQVAEDYPNTVSVRSDSRQRYASFWLWEQLSRIVNLNIGLPPLGDLRSSNMDGKSRSHPHELSPLVARMIAKSAKMKQGLQVR